MKTSTATTTTTTKPVDNEPKPKHETIDPTKTYQYTWPGQKPSKCNGATLLLLLKGANFGALDISEVVAKDAPKGDEPADDEQPADVAAPKGDDKPTSPEVGKVGAK